MSDHEEGCPVGDGEAEPQLIEALGSVLHELSGTMTHIAEVLERGEFWHASEDTKHLLGLLMNGPVQAMLSLAIEHKQVPPDVQAKLDQLEAAVREHGDDEDVGVGGYI